MSHQAVHLTWFVDVSTIPQSRYYGILQKWWKPTYCHISSGKWMGMIHQSFIISRDLSIFKRFCAHNFQTLNPMELLGTSRNIANNRSKCSHRARSVGEMPCWRDCRRSGSHKIVIRCQKSGEVTDRFAKKVVSAPKQWMVLKDWWLYYTYCI